ncbi:acyl-CoA synthetase (AMP-forming)/AMP-acid ligase II [Pelagimonas varians]|uniref:Long-chain-fatty-acid--CoA ligase n=2 Tax=Pelagimonas varians TaxID=696760 RepID=A0A238L3X2_9RHOB|nr:acyl-CoA synthetase (AMP-forming)/AMP-acid ligase II [Pelagimonas varians]SMX49677.1 Long-chain-fatty-acid--CoA ligase [Pelagimonas varians]
MRIHDVLAAQAKAHPQAPALNDSLGFVWTYSDLNQTVEALALELTDLGVQRNDRVLLVMENCGPAVAMLFAASKVGAVLIPFNARQLKADVARVIEHSTPAVAVFTSAVSKEAAEHAKDMGATPLTAAQGSLQAAPLASDPAEELCDVGTILYTTGTTAAPKGVMLTHDNLCFGGGVSRDVRKITPADVLYGVLPMSHVFGLASVVMASVLSGASIRIEPRFSPANLYQALLGGVTLLSSVPQMLAQLMHYTREQGHETLPVETLRYISSGAAPLDIDWKRKAEGFFGLPLQNGYGMTEGTAGICLTQHEGRNDDISVGQPFPGVQIALDKDAPGGGGDIGEILVAGGGVMQGYFRNPEATDQVFTADGWMRTGDLGRLDAGGNLHIMGRSKELIIHGGFNVYPPEVEAALNDHPQVIQCAVIGIMDAGDEKVCAFVEAARNDWPEEADLRSFAADRLAGYKRPSRIVVVEKLPAAPTGKILKTALPALL